MGNDEYGLHETGDWINETSTYDPSMPTTTPQPPYIKDEPWSELPPLKKISPGSISRLIDEMRKEGIPVRGSGLRRAGIFSGGRVNVTLSVPDRLRAEALRIQAQFFPDQ